MIIAGTEAVLIDRGSGSGPWFRCRGVGTSIESADREYAIITARSLIDILG